jgi:hypothetical protein
MAHEYWGRGQGGDDLYVVVYDGVDGEASRALGSDRISEGLRSP